MKKSTLCLILLIAVMTLPVFKVKSQWLTNGNALGAAGLLGSTNNKAYSLISNNNQRIRITANGNIQLGSNAVLNSLPTNYAQFDSDGDLRFYGTGNYLVPANGYVFRLEDDEDMGLFFNTALGRYEFRDSEANPVFDITSEGDAHASMGFEVGPEFGYHLTFGANEITARNSNQIATLWLQKDGGNTQFGANTYPELFIWQSTGRVGIRTSGPARELEVVHKSGSGASYGLMISNEEANNQDWTLYTNNSDGDLSFYQNGLLAGEFSDLDGVYTPSDARLKTNVKGMETVLDRIMKLEPKTYNYIKSENPNKTHIGFIAQEMEKQFPEIVGRAGESQDTYVMNYSLLSVLAIKAIQEQLEMITDQQETIEKQDQKIGELESEIASIKAMLSQAGMTSGVTEKSSAGEKENMLYQNQPNPFSDKTTIKVWLKQDVTSAFIKIVTLHGETIATIPVTGQGDVEINAGSLPSGSYFYSLIVDGKVIDSKKMVVMN